MKLRHEHYAHFQNKVKSLKKMVNAEEKLRAEFRDEMRKNTPCSLSE
jgi:hypothetical protein